MPKTSKCKYCKENIFWFLTRNGKNIPIQEDSVAWGTVEYKDGHPYYVVGAYEPHFRHCAPRANGARPPSYQKFKPGDYNHEYEHLRAAHNNRGSGFNYEQQQKQEERWQREESQQTEAWTSPATGHYGLLFVMPSAPDSVLRAAFKALTLLYHPDRTGPEGHEKMVALNTAWDWIKQERGL